MVRAAESRHLHSVYLRLVVLAHSEVEVEGLS